MGTRIDKCFWVEPTGESSWYLRRYHCGKLPPEVACLFHQAQVQIENGPSKHSPEGYLESRYAVPRADPRWPARCDCGYEFTTSDVWQCRQELIYVRPDTGERFEGGYSKMPAGAMFNAWWHHGFWVGPDGLSLSVVLPGGHIWHIDSQANNCDQPERPHQCWIRHGIPPKIDVDKNGDTCRAGGGSIKCYTYHAMLQEGELRELPDSC